SKGLADTAPLPYAYLDYINTQLNGGLATVHSGSAKFTELQRNYVWALNCWNHNGKAQSGFLVSDVPATEDRYWQLSTKGCLDFPQVDHILPKSKGGNNAFANAQLTSAWYNNDKKDGIVRDAEQRRQSLEARLKLNLRSNAATGHRASIKEHFESTYLARLEQEDQRQQKKAKLLAERRATATPPDTI
ncbi:MAG: hypothetical protein MUF00_16590, partial [Gemmatimonadaceae bacterium]|nr:hypothetical protein [Gemmatimonadaceae bacterium]